MMTKGDEWRHLRIFAATASRHVCIFAIQIQTDMKLLKVGSINSVYEDNELSMSSINKNQTVSYFGIFKQPKYIRNGHSPVGTPPPPQAGKEPPKTFFVKKVKFRSLFRLTRCNYIEGRRTPSRHRDTAHPSLCLRF